MRWAAFYVFLLVVFSSVPGWAQFQAVYAGVNGLTCSQCSRTVELSIRKLDFVDLVQMNLQRTEAQIILKQGKKVDIDKVAQAIIDAGFSVRYLNADLVVDNTISFSGTCFTYKGDGYVFATAPKGPLKGMMKLKFLGKKYMPKNEMKQVAADMKCGGATGKMYQVVVTQ